MRRETLQGKGHVVRRMFADVEADVYVLVDGDDTYDAEAASGMVHMLLADQLDMVTAARLPVSDAAYRPGHRIGNRLLSFLVCRVFGNRVSDLLSGYRVFSRRFVKSFPALVGRIRDGNRIHHPRAGAEDADRRDGHELSRPFRRIAIEAAHCERRAAHPARHHEVGEAGAAAAIIRRDRCGPVRQRVSASVCRWCCISCAPAWFRGFRPPCLQRVWCWRLRSRSFAASCSSRLPAGGRS